MPESKKVVCRIRLKDGVLDPQAVTIKNALTNLGYHSIASVHSGKIYELEFTDGSGADIEALSEEICRKVLSNPVIETFSIEVL